MNSVEIAKVLVENGADVNARDYIKISPLHYVENAEVARVLIENGAISYKV